ncbi:hypothetical protein ILYODFUR_000614 [Ilyodon furcidens]|uniref:Uncharacterized protein n=1 Tax=Ilyodon furcidens TaxID=33524 RepID=A0ABV0SUW1_9TELE
MYLSHNSAAISHSALSVSSPTLLLAVFGMKKPHLISGWILMLTGEDGCLILVAVFDIVFHFSHACSQLADALPGFSGGIGQAGGEVVAGSGKRNTSGIGGFL